MKCFKIKKKEKYIPEKNNESFKSHTNVNESMLSLTK